MTKRKFVVFILIVLLALGNSGSVDAQWWKRKKEKKYARKHKSNKEKSDNEIYESQEMVAEQDAPDKKELKRRGKMERKRLKREHRKLRRKGNDENGDEAVAKSKKKHGKQKKDVIYPATQMKSTYRIDFLASLYLDELVKNGNLTFKDKIPDKAYAGISFYQGLNIAADSLKKAGYNVEIYVHDITSAEDAPEKLIANGRLDSADLIIGAFHSQDMPLVAAYAKKRQINFVSALSPADGGVRDNQFFTMVQPSLKTHCEWIIDEVSKKYPGNDVLLMHRAATVVDENAFNYLNNYNDGYVHFKDIICNGLPGRETILPLIDTSKTNVIVIAVLDPGYADSLLRVLSEEFPDTKFEIYGMPSWYVINDIHLDGTLPNLAINVTMPFSIDQASPTAKYISRKYKSDYTGKAGELVFRGYETLFWYAHLLRDYGTIFNLNYSDNSGAPFTKYDIKLKKDKEGNVQFHENTHIYLTRYGGGGNNRID